MPSAARRSACSLAEVNESNVQSLHALLSDGDDMARRRLQQKGDLTNRSGFWWLRWKADKLNEDGSVYRGWTKRIAIAQSEGPDAKTKRQAKRLAWDNFLSRHDQNQQMAASAMTLAAFVEKRFIPQYVALQKPTTQSYLRSILKHILPALGDKRLTDVCTADVQDLVQSKLKADYKPSPTKDSRRKYSTRILYSIRNTVSAIYSFADRMEAFTGRNPAKHVALPEKSPVRNLGAPSAAQVRQLIAALPEPAHGMALMAALTGMNIAEICGLRWAWANLSDVFLTVEGETLPPMSLAVRYQWVRGKYGSVKAPKRRRIIPIVIDLAVYLVDKRGAPDAPVFAGGTGRPCNQNNIMTRHVKPAAKTLGFGWVGWHSLRRSLATMLDAEGASMADRMATLGHAQAGMTLHYTRSDIERRRELLESVAGRVTEGRVQ